MKTRGPSLLREPLVQFLLIGAAIVGIAHFQGRGSQPPASLSGKSVTITAGKVAELRALATRAWQREPTETELGLIIDAAVREEILAREARALGLAEEDNIIRQRLAQKMEFLLEPPPGAIAPTDDDLRAFLAQNPGRYRQEPRVAFRQVTLSPDVHGHALPQVADEALGALRGGTDPESLSDETLLPGTVEETAIGNVRRVFGPDFSQALMDLPVGKWSGPVASPYGTHLVLVTAQTRPPDPALGDVRDAVMRDYRLDRETRYIDEAFQELRAAYTVTIDWPEEASDPAPATGAPGG